MQSSGECLTGCSLILCNSLGQTSFSLDFLLTVQGTPSLQHSLSSHKQISAAVGGVSSSFWTTCWCVYMDAACSCLVAMHPDIKNVFSLEICWSVQLLLWEVGKKRRSAVNRWGKGFVRTSKVCLCKLVGSSPF